MSLKSIGSIFGLIGLTGPVVHEPIGERSCSQELPYIFRNSFFPAAFGVSL